MRNRRIIQTSVALGLKSAAFGPAAWLVLALATAAPQDSSPIGLEFYGYTEQAPRRAFLRERDKIFVAAEGELILDRYRLLRIEVESESVVVEDISTASRQTLPLAARKPNGNSAVSQRPPSISSSPVLDGPRPKEVNRNEPSDVGNATVAIASPSASAAIDTLDRAGPTSRDDPLKAKRPLLRRHRR